MNNPVKNGSQRTSGNVALMKSIESQGGCRTPELETTGTHFRHCHSSLRSNPGLRLSRHPCNCHFSKKLDSYGVVFRSSVPRKRRGHSQGAPTNGGSASPTPNSCQNQEEEAAMVEREEEAALLLLRPAPEVESRTTTTTTKSATSEIMGADQLGGGTRLITSPPHVRF